MPKIIGLSGRVGSGKSMAQSCLPKDKSHEVIDLDLLGHELLTHDDVKIGLTALFGNKIIDESGDISRPILGDIVFNNVQALQDLNKFVHPKIALLVEQRIDQSQSKNILIVGALLQEIGLLTYCNTVLVIDVPDEILKKRLNDKLPILSQQRSRDAYQKEADLLIVNDFSPRFITQCKVLFEEILI